MSLSPAFLDELRLRTSLSSLIGRSIKLQKAGREFKACCPFHNEKTPSFTVNDEKGFYHCFGCSAHGDAISWLTDARGLTFMDAVKELADAAGMEVPTPDPRAQAKAERATSLYEVMSAASAWFIEQLDSVEGEPARAYLATRGITDLTRKRFGFGFAPDSRGKLKTALNRFGTDKLVEAGLLIQPDGEKEPYDRFRGRLTYPIRDARGRVIAFSARIVGTGEPKYLNSPDTPLFDKGRTLFNLDKGGPASRTTHRIIVVEGQMDVIALDQAGLEDCVAPLGTAVTEDQLRLLWKMHDVPVLCFDGDAAGTRAAIRAGLRALPILPSGKSLAIATLPYGYDPDDLIRQRGVTAFEDIVGQARPLVRVLYENEVQQRSVDTPEGRAGLRDRLDQLAEDCSQRVLQEEYRRSFRDLFYNQFGWKKSDRNVIGDSIIKTGPHGNKEILKSFIRSALYGLARYPSVIAHNLEELGRIKINHSDLLRWRDVMAEAVYIRPTLDDDAVREILETAQLSPLQRRDLRFDLRFPFTRRGALAVDASTRLEELIRMLAAEQSLDEEMQRLDAEAANDNALENYDHIQSQRQHIWELKLELREKAYERSATDPTEEG